MKFRSKERTPLHETARSSLEISSPLEKHALLRTKTHPR